MSMYEPPSRPTRPAWIWPVVGLLVLAAVIALAVVAGGPWVVLILVVTLVWAFFGIRFILSERGKRILFGRFDERYQDPSDRR